MSEPRFFNRELSWLEFNQRVLEEALDASNPLLERLKFFCIVSSNLDEFFEVRVAGLKQQIESGGARRSRDGLTASQIFHAITRRVRRMLEEQYRCWNEELKPGLARNGIRLLEAARLAPEDLRWLESYYRAEVRPVLTPLGIDPAHPFPQLLNKSLNLIVQVERKSGRRKAPSLAVVQAPRLLPRLVHLPRPNRAMDFVFLEDAIGYFLQDLFPGSALLGHWRFRLTRNSELYIDEEDAANLLQAVERELHKRRRGDTVRLEIGRDCPLPVRAELLRQLRLSEDDLFVIDGPLHPSPLLSLCDGDHSPELRHPPWVAAPLPLKMEEGIFAAIRQRDWLAHHPFESFGAIVEFLQQAAEDPSVLAIKQTLYRTGGDPRVIGALMRAVEMGKQVTAVVELKARFDEARNIQWARQLEEAGVHVVYGLMGLKIHAKLCLVVRKDPDGIRRYLHISTGNYNPVTARQYTDVGLLTCQSDFGEDATSAFNLLTGICEWQPSRKLCLAPFELHQRILSLIGRETANARAALPARIIAKMNSLVDEEVISALYEASQAGVSIDLIVRGICCLKPKIKGLSERIQVTSVIDRFLEHSRVFYFENACRPEVFLSSADWMPRNFFRRVEVLFPIEDGNLRERILSEILAAYLGDNCKAWRLQPDGSYRRAPVKRGMPRRRAQSELMEAARRANAQRSAPPPARWPLAPSPFASNRGGSADARAKENRNKNARSKARLDL